MPKTVLSLGVLSTKDEGLLCFVADKLGYKPTDNVFPPMFILRDWIQAQPESDCRTKLIKLFITFNIHGIYEVDSVLLCDKRSSKPIKEK